MQFQIGEIVWGKVQGYPYWPCTISYDLPDVQKCRVVFYGDGQQGELKYTDLKKFDEHFEQYCLPAKKAYLLRLSIEQALGTDNTRPLLPKFEKIIKGNTKNQDKTKQVETKQQKQQPRKIDLFIQKHFKDLSNETINKIIKICENNFKKVVKAIKAYSSLQTGIVNKIFNIESFEKYYQEAISQSDYQSILQQIPKSYEIKIFF